MQLGEGRSSQIICESVGRSKQATKSRTGALTQDTLCTPLGDSQEQLPIATAPMVAAPRVPAAPRQTPARSRSLRLVQGLL